jgi:hypothetical protein
MKVAPWVQCFYISMDNTRGNGVKTWAVFTPENVPMSVSSLANSVGVESTVLVLSRGSFAVNDGPEHGFTDVDRSTHGVRVAL